MTSGSDFSPVKNASFLSGLSDEIRKLIDEVGQHHSANIRQVFNTGKLCKTLYEKLGTRPRREIMDYLHMDDATFSRYLSIGRLPDDLVAQLPQKLRVLYGVASMKDAEREDAVQEGLLTRELTAVRLEQWKREKRGMGTRETGKVLATVIDPGDDSLRARAVEKLTHIAQEGIEVTFPDAQAAKRKGAAERARVLNTIRTLKDKFGDVSLAELERRVLTSRESEAPSRSSESLDPRNPIS